MQRETPEGIILCCDFCRRDWDGQEAMVEGHHGSIICLPCLKLALEQLKVGDDKYKCNLCLRFNIPQTLAKWSHPDHPDAVIAGIASSNPPAHSVNPRIRNGNGTVKLPISEVIGGVRGMAERDAVAFNDGARSDTMVTKCLLRV
jgi:hypothetical protein